MRLLSEEQAEKVFNDNLKIAHDILGKSVTLTSQLDKAGKTFFKNRYIGTFAADEIPDNFICDDNYQYMIVNNETRDHGGEHWVAVANTSGVLHVFDSFGRPTKDLIPSLYAMGTVKDSDYDKDQKETQEDCGSRCIAWLMLFDKYGAENALLI